MPLTAAEAPALKQLETEKHELRTSSRHRPGQEGILALAGKRLGRPESKDWKSAKIMTCGIDVGSVSSQAVLVADGELYGYNSMRTGNNSPDSAKNALQGVDGPMRHEARGHPPWWGTGYGRVNVPFAHKAITEIACHARGANYMGGNGCAPSWTWAARTARPFTATKRQGHQLPDERQCAAGTGRGMEVISDLMQIPDCRTGSTIL